MQPIGPIFVLDLFPQERQRLLELLSSLSEQEWSAPTVCPGWSVKDIALHLLGDDIGYLSSQRDHFSNPFFRDKDMHTWESLVQNLNAANELWVQATARISPQLLCELLALTGKQFYAYLQTRDQMALNGVVSWAGPDRAPTWLDTAREYTERWLHHQQIRDAVKKPGLKEKTFFHPILDTFVRALPHTYRDIPVTAPTAIKFVVTGEAGDTWYLVGADNRWSLYTTVELPLTTTVTMDQETCWRLFTKGITREQASTRTTIAGEQTLGQHLLSTVSIIA